MSNTYFHYSPKKRHYDKSQTDPYALTKWLRDEAGDNSTYLLCMRKALGEVMERELTDVQRLYINMRYFQNLNLQEIADAVGVDPSTVSRTLKRAFERVKKALDYVYLGAVISSSDDDWA